MKRKDTTKQKEEESLRREILKAKLELDTAYSNFENVIDPDLIDCYIYQVNSIQKRYKYLLRQAKEHTTIGDTDSIVSSIQGKNLAD